MNYILRDLASSEKFEKYLKVKKYPVTISGIAFVAKAQLLALTYEETRKPICIITYNEIQAKNLQKNLSYFLEEGVLYFPKREIMAYDYVAESSENQYERIDILNDIYNNKAKIIITTIEAVMQSMPPKDIIYKSVLNLKLGDTISHDEIKKFLLEQGYKRTDLIENRGEFCIRGDIIDIGVKENDGIRIEFWGDDIDSIRKFKISSQRSTDMLENVDIYPAKELLLEDSLENVCKRIKENKKEYSLEDVERIVSGDYENKIDKYFNEFYKNKSNFIEYINKCQIYLDEPEKIEQRIEAIKKDNESFINALIDKEKPVPEILENFSEFCLRINDVINLKELDTLDDSFNTREVNLFRGDVPSFKKEVEEALKFGKKVVILAGDKDNAIKIRKIFENEIVIANSLDNIWIKEGEAIIAQGALTSGFEDEDTKLLVISSDEFFAKSKAIKRISNTFKNGEKIVFADLKIGDYIVHKNHGIGIFVGVKTIKTDGITKDYIELKYKDGDILYVPTDDLDNVRKYIGGEGNLKLNKLGTKEWENTKSKVKGNLRAVAKELIELYARREKSVGFAFSKDSIFQNQFENSFKYKETNDQLRCIEEVKKDMEAPRPMDRLLCGDVGYGKTEVAIRAAFKAVMDSKQVVYLAPTTILAGQQYKEFKERMEEYPIKIELLNRFRTSKEQKEVIKKLKTGEVDIVLGTHRVLSKDVEFKDLGLLIIDEEHRFGVKAKEKIKQYKNEVDVLTMTATPIPRTLQMSIVGIRDMSVIYEPPQNRRPVQTYVLEYDREVIKEAITKELERGGQVFYIYNIVDTISTKAAELSSLVPEARVSYAHGRMSGKEVEDIMQEFVEKKTNVLVCTTILESGIDIPNANTMIVENADRFGLAQLYQIRGRVGRSDRQAYAYITYKRDKMLSEDASKRLKAIKEFTEFGAGFKIATRDLQIRGAGSIFGEIQHGHMEQVGYDMYNRLLDEVVKELKGEKIDVEEEISIDLSISSYIPEEYIDSSSQKIEIYQDIANSKSEEEVQNVIDEIIDRYGEMPKEVHNLIEIARIKNLCREQGVIKLQQKQNAVLIYYKNGEKIDIANVLQNYGNRVRFSPGEKPYITLKIEKDVVKELKEFLK